MLNAVRSTSLHLMVYGTLTYVGGLVLYKVVDNTVAANLTLLTGFLLLVAGLFNLCLSYAQ